MEPVFSRSRISNQNHFRNPSQKLIMKKTGKTLLYTYFVVDFLELKISEVKHDIVETSINPNKLQQCVCG